MPNIKSQIKRDRTNKEANLRNSSRKSEAKTACKRVEKLVNEGNKEEANLALNHAISLLDKLAQDGIIAHNNATRKKAHLQHLVASL